MLRTNVYLTEEQERQLKMRAILNKKPKAQVLRELIDEGLKAISIQGSASARSLLNLAEIGRKYKAGGAEKTSAVEEIDKMWQSWGKGNE